MDELHILWMTTYKISNLSAVISEDITLDKQVKAKYPPDVSGGRRKVGQGAFAHEGKRENLKSRKLSKNTEASSGKPSQTVEAIRMRRVAPCRM
jgi:hypothetical protein